MRKQPPTGRQKRAREPRRPLPRRDREPTNGYEKKSNGKTSRHWAAPPHTSTDDQCHTEGDWTGSPRRISKSHRAAKPSATAADRLAVAARTDAAASAAAAGVSAPSVPKSNTSRRDTAEAADRRRRPAADRPAGPCRTITDAGVPRPAAASARVLTTPLAGEGVLPTAPPPPSPLPSSPPPSVVVMPAAAAAAATVRGGMDVRGRLDGRLAGRAGVVRERGREGDETGEPGGEPRGGDAGGEEVRVMVRWRGGRAGGVKCCTGPSTAAGAE